jgi:galactonate dehydratase
VQIQDAEIFRLPVLRGSWLIVRLRTNQGIGGLGDASHSGDDAQTAREIRRMLEMLRGRPVNSVECLRSQLNGSSVAFSAIEQAIWDISGKIAGLPVSDLLGGAVHPAIRLYANINRTTRPRTPEAFASMASQAIEAGFDTVKLAPFDELPQREAPGEPAIAAVRAAIGEAGLMVDVHERFEGSAAIELVERMEEYRLYWLEETSPRLSDLAKIRRMAKIRSAGGEKLFGVKGFLPYVQAGAVDVLMPDVKLGGGLLQVKCIAALAEAAGMLVSPHGPASPVGDQAAAQVAATMPNFLILEHVFGEVPWGTDLVSPPQRIRKGCLELSPHAGFQSVLQVLKLRLAHH